MEQATFFFLALLGLIDTYTHDKYLLPVYYNSIWSTPHSWTISHHK